MDWLVEDPWPIVGCAAVAEGLLAIAFYNTRRTAILWVMAVVLLLALAGWLVEWLVVTEREEVENTLYGAAAALETNDPPKVLEFVAPDATVMRTAVQSILPRFQISEAKVGSDLKITFNRLTDPPTARAEFTARVTVKNRDASQPFPYDNYVRRFAIKLRRHGDRWLLSEYETGDSLDNVP